MKTKEKRDTIFYTRIKKANNRFFLAEMKRLGYTNKSEFHDDLLTALAGGTLNDRQKKRIRKLRKKVH